RHLLVPFSCLSGIHAYPWHSSSTPHRHSPSLPALLATPHSCLQPCLILPHLTLLPVHCVCGHSAHYV
ncbi:hypothetical protein C0993_006827, partial [Termitomyces sp. T159_Od127]